MGALWFALNLSFNVSLQLSSVSSVTIISATSSIWTLLIGAARAREAPSRLKVLATPLTLARSPALRAAARAHKSASLRAKKTPLPRCR